MPHVPGRPGASGSGCATANPRFWNYLWFRGTLADNADADGGVSL